MLPAPICYLYIMLSNNVQMSWSTKYQPRKMLQCSTTQHNKAK